MDSVEVLGTTSLPSHFANCSQRESGHMISNLGNVGFNIKVRIESLDDGLVLQKIQAWAHHAGCNQTQLALAEAPLSKISQGGSQKLVAQRTKVPLHQFVQSGGGIGHFASL